MLKVDKIGWKFIAFSAIFLVSSNVLFLVFFQNSDQRLLIHDVDRESNGNTFIACCSYNELKSYPERVEERIPVEEDSPEHRVLELDSNGQIVWELTGLSYPHEVEQLPNGHLLIADTGYDRVIEVNYPDTDIIWSWEPKEINWTQVNTDWDSGHYYNNYFNFDWTHLNDVDFKEYDDWDACLISIRNFNLVVEINFTAEMEGPSNDPSNIVWYYGDYNDDSLLYQQHNPGYLENENIIIADSQNDRIIEVDKESKEIVWEYDEDLKWPRDADETEEGNILITDSANNRVIEIEKESKEIVWTYETDSIEPYETDRLETGNILIGGGVGGYCAEVNQNGIIVWIYGINFFRTYFYMNLIELMGFQSLGVYSIFRTKRTEITDLKRQKKKRFFFIAFCVALVIETMGFFTYNYIINAIFSITNFQSPR